MKKTIKGKLKFGAESIRVLRRGEMSDAVGGLSNGGCPNTDQHTCISDSCTPNTGLAPQK